MRIPGPHPDWLEKRIQQRVDNLPVKLQAHIFRAQEVAREIAACHQIDPKRAALGVLAHDVARAMAGAELLRRAGEFNLPVRAVERRVPILLHGPVGAEILRREEGLALTGETGSLYQAVYWHTTAHPNLDDLGKVVFLADKLDPNKRKSYPYQPLILDLARSDLDGAILEFLSRQGSDLAQGGREVHPMALEVGQALRRRLRLDETIGPAYASRG